MDHASPFGWRLMASDLPCTQVSSHMKRSPLSFTNKNGPWNQQNACGCIIVGSGRSCSCAPTHMPILWPSPVFTPTGVYWLRGWPYSAQMGAYALHISRSPPMSPVHSTTPLLALYCT